MENNNIIIENSEDLGAAKKSVPQLVPASTVIDENTGFQVLNCAYAPGESYQNKTHVFEIDRNYTHVVGIAFIPQKTYGGSFVPEHIQIQTQEGIIINKVNASFLFNRCSLSERRGNTFNPIFFRAAGGQIKITAFCNLTSTFSKLKYFTVVLLLKNNVKNYPYEYDFHTAKINIPSFNLNTPYNHYCNSFSLPTFPINYSDCIGIIGLRDPDQEKDLFTASFLSIRKGNQLLANKIPMWLLYEPEVITESLPNSNNFNTLFTSAFFPVFIKNCSGQNYEIVYDSDSKGYGGYIEFIFLLRRPSIRY